MIKLLAASQVGVACTALLGRKPLLPPPSKAVRATRSLFTLLPPPSKAVRATRSLFTLLPPPGKAVRATRSLFTLLPPPSKTVRATRSLFTLLPPPSKAVRATRSLFTLLPPPSKAVRATRSLFTLLPPPSKGVRATRSLFKLIVFISCFLFSTLLNGCGDKLKPKDDFIASLADTVWAGEEKDIVLTTGTGAWYYADALGSPRRSIYGFYLLETKLYDDWELKNQTGESVRENAEYAVVHPEFCIRHYPSGVEERIECIPGHDAIAISYTFKSSPRTLFRVFSSRFNTKATDAQSDEQSSTHISSFPFKTALVFSKKPLSSVGMFQKRVEYPQSALMGEPKLLDLYSDREYTLFSTNKWTCLFAASEDSIDPVPIANSLLKHLPQYRKKHRQQSEAALTRFTFRCERKSVEKAYAWARIMLAGMYFERDGESLLFAGLPHSPYMDSFHSSLAGTGLLLADSSRSRSVRLFETILARQMDPGDLEFPARLPTEIRSDLSVYQSGTTSGALTLSFDRIVALSDSVPLGLPTHLLEAINRAVGADLNSAQHVLGLLTGPGLFPNIGFPPRERHGALFETQALFVVARTYLATHREGGTVSFEVPEQALKGASEWQFPYLPAIAVGLAEKQFQMPLTIGSMMSRYRNRAGLWSDRLLIPEFADEALITSPMVYNTPHDSTKSVVPLLSVYWLEKQDKRNSDKLISMAEKTGLIAEKGFRSLSRNEADFQSSHVFVYDDHPVDAKLSGDVLIWTAGMLADLYTLTARHDVSMELFNALSETVLGEGVIGGLPETENGIFDNQRDNTGRNPLFASSLGEYIRILYDDILGVDTKRQTYPAVRLTVPPEWGKVKFSFEAAGAIITIERLNASLWTARQDGSKDQIPLEVELWSEPDIRGYGSLKLNPNMIVNFKVISTSIGRYSLAWEEFTREK